MNTDKHTVTLSGSDYLDLIRQKKLNNVILDLSTLTRILKEAGVIFDATELGGDWLTSNVGARVEISDVVKIIFYDKETETK